MVYTITFNPSLDYFMKTSDISLGHINRSSFEKIYFGGKGINVSAVLSNLGIENTALGFTAGFTGSQIEDMLHESGVVTDFVHLRNGFSRINVKISAGSEGSETEINGSGPEIDNDSLYDLYQKLDKLSSGDILVLAGSIPKCLSHNTYNSIINYLGGKDILFTVDATNELLVNTLAFRPFLIKPNRLELSEIFKKDLKTDDEITSCALELHEKGAQNVLVSMGANGAILVDSNEKIHKIKAPEGIVKNSVGAGDSMVAGFIAGYLENQNYTHALKLGTAAGSATAFSGGLGDAAYIKHLYNIL